MSNDVLERNDLCIRNLDDDDFERGYLDLMYEFTNLRYPLDNIQFRTYIREMSSTCQIVVIYSNVLKKNSAFEINYI